MDAIRQYARLNRPFEDPLYIAEVAEGLRRREPWPFRAWIAVDAEGEPTYGITYGESEDPGLGVGSQ